jgi:hypothetical protein
VYGFAIDKGTIGAIQVNQVKTLVFDVLDRRMTPRQPPIWDGDGQLAIATDCPDSLRLLQTLRLSKLVTK